MTGSHLPADLKLDGHDLSEIIRSADAPSSYDAVHWMFGNDWAVLEGNWKLIGQGDEARSLGNLRDLEPEMKNYLNEEPDVATRLKALHDDWLNEVQPGH